MRFKLVTVIAGPLAVLGAAMSVAALVSAVDAHAEVAAVLYAASATQAAMAKSLDGKLRVVRRNPITQFAGTREYS
jgi:hypothetical protein